MKLMKYLAFVAMIVLTACSQGTKIDYVPDSAKLEYDVVYSEDLKSSGIAGQFLPRRLSGMYSSDGVKMSATGALGMFKLNVVLTPDRSFVTIDLEDERLMMDLNDMLNDMAEVSTDSFVRVLEDDTIIDISGWPSKHMSITCLTSEKLGYDLNVSVFYVEADFDREFRFVKNAPMTKIPGMITAMSIHLGETNVLATLNSVEDCKVEPSNFLEPRGYMKVNIAEVDSLMGAYMK